MGRRGLYYTIVPCYIGPAQTLESSFEDSDLKPEDMVTFHIVLKNHHRPINPADHQEDDNIASSNNTQPTYYGFWDSKRSITTFSHPFHHPDYLPIEYFIRSIDHNNVNGFSELPWEFWIIVRDKIISFINRQLLFEMDVMTGFEMVVDVNVAEGCDPAYLWWTWCRYSAYLWWYWWYGASADASLSFDHEVSADQEDEPDEIDHGDGGDDDELDMERIAADITEIDMDQDEGPEINDCDGSDDELDMDHIVAGIEALLSS